MSTPQSPFDSTRRALRGVLFCTLVGLGLSSLAQDAAPGPAWASLSPAQRSVLAPLERDWSGIDNARKAKWLELATRFPALPPDEKQRVQQRMGEWARMSPAERGRARLSFLEAKQMTREERQAQWQAYQALPPEKREELAARNTPSRRAPRVDAGASAPATGAKRNIVTNQALSTPPAAPVAPTVLQARPGATTTLLNQQAAPPAHQQTGLPKIAATPAFVDRTTLLPKRGPQGAAVRSAAAASSPAAPTPPQ